MGFLAILITCLALFGNPAQGVEGKGKASAQKSRPTQRQLTWKELADMCFSSGTDSYFPHQVGTHLGFEGDPPTKDLGIEETDTTDWMHHELTLILKNGSKETEPIVFDFLTTHNWPGHGESYHFRVSLEGTLEKAIFISGLRDELGKAIKGSGSLAEKDIGSPEIKQRFQHEVDFWLKGAYRKKKAKPRPAKGGIR